MKVKLRALKEDDIWVMHKWINDREILKYTNNFKPVSEMEQKQWFGSFANLKGSFIFGIEVVEERKLIGYCGFYNIHNINRNAELRIKIGNKDYWSKGLGSLAAKELIEFGFNDLNLYKIWLKVMSGNLGAVNLYQKIGFVQEGLLKKELYIKGEYKDIIIMSLLKEDKS